MEIVVGDGLGVEIGVGDGLGVEKGVVVRLSGVIFVVEELNVFSGTELHAIKEIIKNNIENNIFMIT